MSLDRVRIADGDYVKWGNLVKAWSRGTTPRPTTVTEFRNQCNDADIGISIPDYVGDVEFVQRDKETLLIRLPPADMIEDAEKQLEKSPYALPRFYKERFNVDLHVPMQQRLDFQAQRIGDYTITLCM
jgi:hypothetical protein